MKQLLVINFIFIFTLSIAQPTIDKKIKDNIARNKIKSQVSWDYKYVGDKPEKTGIKTSITTYTPVGDVLQVTTYNAKGQILHIEKYKYDNLGNKTEYTRYSGGAETNAAYQKLSEYDAKGNLIEESGYDGVENFKDTYVYNSKGDLAEIRYLKDNVLKEKRVFIKNGNATTVSIFNPSGGLSSKLVLRYDDKGNLKEETVFGVNENPLEKKTYNYDEKKNLKEEAKYKLDKITLKTTYNYNSGGDLLEITEETPGSAKYVKKGFKYDASGNLIEIKWRRKGTEEFNTITYAYDAKGICATMVTNYPATSYKVLTKYTYEFF
jgi:hypothetical protein